MDEVRADVDRSFELEAERHVAARAGPALGVRVIDPPERRRSRVTSRAAAGRQHRLCRLRRTDLDGDRPRERDVFAKIGPPAFDVEVVRASGRVGGYVMRPRVGHRRRPARVRRIERAAEEIARGREGPELRVDAVPLQRARHLHIVGVEELVEVDDAADRLRVSVRGR